MKKVDTSSALCHILVCVNSREQSSSLPCCASAGAEEVYEAFHSWIKSHHLLARIWLTRTECMGWCHVEGTTIAFYPDDIWYRAVAPEDCQDLIDQHLSPLIASTPFF